ncbi:MAG: thiamine phosphate synthase [Deltaproteobacteria bacterium]|nr:MAG: thiamine phosphate synthase [Deltaproteobacteria bacterium]
MIAGLYGILDMATLARRGLRLRPVADALIDAGVRVLQLRWKDAPAAALLEAARTLGSRIAARGGLFIVNDRADVAALAGAGGVHLGQTDLPVGAARRVLPASARVGVSTHNLEELRRALAAGADYVGFGPVFPTASKPNPDPVVGLEGLAEAVRLAAPVPVVAIGGITEETMPQVAGTGAAAAAVIGDLLAWGEPGARASALSAAFAAGAP